MIYTPPNTEESWIVWNCFLQFGILLGSEEEVWSHQFAFAGLKTMRLLVETIKFFAKENQEISVYNLETYLLKNNVEFNNDQYSYSSEMSDFLIYNPRARVYWQSLLKDDKFPHLCPFCGRAAYIGFMQIECKAKCDAKRQFAVV